MSTRRALIIAPLYDGKWLPLLAGRSVLVERLSQCLEDYGHYDIKVLDGIVTQGKFRESIYDFFDTDGELLFYFYGHGCLRRSGQGVFATSKARLYDEGVEMSEVTQAALNSKAKEVVLILDCCHAGAAYPIVKSTLSSAVKEISSGVGRCLLAACAEHQQGWESKTDDDEILGAFSSHILEGLAGAARYGQAKVRASLLGAYVTDAFNSWKQNPISQTYETGSRHCVITYDFPHDTSSIPHTQSDDNNPLTFAALKELAAELVKDRVSVNDQPLILAVPFKPSQLFVGRSAEIDYLHTMLVNSDKPVAVSATVEGLGGIGKTELVLQLIYHPDISATYKTIVWIDGAGPIPPQWQKVAHDLEVKNPPEEPADLVHKVEQKLRQRGNSLIILDNATEWNSVSEVMPRSLPLLVTTRTHGFGGNRFNHLELQVLSDEAAKDFLVRIAPELANDPSLLRLIRVLDGHTLALELAGWNINYLGLSAREYIERLNKDQADSHHALSATRYGKTVESCLTVTWENLRYPASRVLWRRASLFAPTSAHRELLKVSCGNNRHIYRAIKRTFYKFETKQLLSLLIEKKGEFSAAYAELRALHILSRVERFNGERWAMHRIVRDYGRAKLRSGEVMVHSIAFSEWLRRRTLPLEPEVPHVVAAILDSARYVGEFEFRGYRRGKSPTREIAFRGLEPLALFNPKDFIYFIRDKLQNPKALTIILEGLIDINEDVRRQAIRLLENVGPIPEVLEGLASSLGDPDPQVRRIAEGSLARYGGEKTISILVAATQSSNQLARLGAIRALGAMGTKAHNALKNALGHDDRKVRIKAALLLCEQGYIEGTKTLVNEIDSVTKWEQIRFINALGTAKDPQGVATIRRFLSVPECRSNAIRLLAQIAPAPEAVEALISCLTYTNIDSEMVIRELAKCTDERTISMLAETVQNPDAQARIGAIRALGLIGKEAHNILKDALQSNDQSVRIEAALLLCEQRQKEGVGILLENINSVPESEQKRFIDALGKAKDKQAISTISSFLFDPQHRIHAIYALREIGPSPEAIDGLIACLGDTNDTVCEIAIKIIKAIGKEAHNILKDALQSNDQSVRIEAALLLCEQRQKEGVGILLENINSVPESEQKRFIDALGKAKDKQAISTISSFLFDPQHRIHAIYALREIGPSPEAIDGLIACLGDTNNTVCEIAIKTIEAIGEKAHRALKAAIESGQLQLTTQSALWLYKYGWEEGIEIVIAALESEAKREDLNCSTYKSFKRFMVTLGHGKVTKAIPTLVYILEHQKYYPARVRAAMTLGAIGDLRARASLVKAAKNDPYVKETAIEAIKEIDKQNDSSC